MSRKARTTLAILGMFAFLGVAGFIAGIAVMAFGDETARGWPDISVLADEVVVYKDTPVRPLHLHIFEPADGADQSVPAVLFFHGGGFAEARLHQFQHQAETVAEVGMAGVVVEYRVTAEGMTRADAIADGRDALAYVQQNADQLGIDADRVAMAGSSAGGALAIEAGGSGNAFVLFNPAVNASSASFVDGQPTLVFHSRADTIVPFSSAEGFCDGVVTCELVAFDEGDHGFFNFEPELSETTEAMIGMLQDSFDE